MENTEVVVDENVNEVDAETVAESDTQDALPEFDFSEKHVKLSLFVPIVCVIVALGTLLFSLLYDKEGVVMILSMSGEYVSADNKLTYEFVDDNKLVVHDIERNSADSIEYTYNVTLQEDKTIFSMTVAEGITTQTYIIEYTDDGFTLADTQTGSMTEFSKLSIS